LGGSFCIKQAVWRLRFHPFDLPITQVAPERGGGAENPANSATFLCATSRAMRLIGITRLIGTATLCRSRKAFCRQAPEHVRARAVFAPRHTGQVLRSSMHTPSLSRYRLSKPVNEHSFITPCHR